MKVHFLQNERSERMQWKYSIHFYISTWTAQNCTPKVFFCKIWICTSNLHVYICLHLYFTIIPKYMYTKSPRKRYLCSMTCTQVLNESLPLLSKRTKSCLESKRLYKQMSNIVIHCLRGRNGSLNGLHIFIPKNTRFIRPWGRGVRSAMAYMSTRAYPTQKWKKMTHTKRCQIIWKKPVRGETKAR